ncbi:latent-transforming growth factor beta-binding protein 4 isoform X2 [Nematostella vectensis]|nr:latent-transforming growth factor beta-binding protein 4 isoform X2 [Nematostella vectensis]
MPRRMPLPFKRSNVIIDRPPLLSKVPVGAAALAPLGTDKHAQVRYAPVQIVKHEENHRLLVQPVCDLTAVPVGISDGYVHFTISDEYFSASSERSSTLSAKMGRLYITPSGQKWCPRDGDRTPWLQIDMNELYYICSVRVDGYTPLDQYVKTFAISVSNDKQNWIYVLENGKEKVFTSLRGTRSSDHLVGLVDTPYRYIRFHPLTSNGAPCMGVEVFGYGAVHQAGLSFPLNELRMTGTVCNLQTDCDRTPGAECARELDKPGTYTCKCKRGYQGPDDFAAGASGQQCLDIDECRTNPCSTPSFNPAISCTNLPGSYRCNCKPGFYHPHDDPTKCADRDECQSLPNACTSNAACSNTVGSYYCRCNIGYRGDGRIKCDDVDECHPPDGGSPCGEFADCVNVDGGYECSCWAGYTGNSRASCKDIDECSGSNDVCKDSNARCINTPGSYKCECPSGMSYNHGTGTCEDKDECASPDENDCSPDANCINKLSSYECVCKPGFKGSGYDVYGCRDIDECRSSPAVCTADHMTCSNTQGSFECNCKKGFSLSADKKSCRDVDECKSGSVTCRANSECHNIIGSYSCTCKHGYTEDEYGSCKEMSWCELEGKAICDKKHQMCDDATKACTVCKPGMEEKSPGNPDEGCIDVDECIDDPCQGGICINTIGSFNCSCIKGYEFDTGLKQCEDIDECHSRKRYCHDNAKCTNSIGSFECKCREGFDGNGIFCADIDECFSEDFECPANSVCANTQGAYKCHCWKGYEMKNGECMKATTLKEGFSLLTNLFSSSTRQQPWLRLFPIFVCTSIILAFM